MRIAVFSGSFNPLHIGHLAILKRLDESKAFDMTYLIVSPKNPLKDIDEKSAESRLKAAREAAARHPELKLKVDDIEFSLPSPQYTIRTLDELKAREPENDFTLVLGADNLASFRQWKEYGRILREYGLVVFPRNELDCKLLADSLKEEICGAKIFIIPAPEVDLSSSQIRLAMSQNEDVSALLM